MACWDALARSQGHAACMRCSAARGPRSSRGSAWGSRRRSNRCSTRSTATSTEGYRRIKLKIAPGWDVEVVRQVRERFPRDPLQVDANSAYTLDDLPTLQALDDFDLLLIEQPLAHDDIIDHARLQASSEDADLPRREHPLGRRRPQGARPGRLPGHQHQGQPAGRPARGEARARRLPRPRRARLVRRDARVRHRPGGQRGDREPARLHPPRRCLGLGQVLRRGHRRAADPGPSGGHRDVRRAGTGRRAGRGPHRGADAPRRSRSQGRGGQHGRPGSLETRRDGRGETRCSSRSRELVQLESPSRDKPALDAWRTLWRSGCASQRLGRS